MKRLLFVLLLLLAQPIFAQGRLSATSGEVRLNASTPLEDINAVNTQISAALDASTGEIAVLLLIREFEFRKRLMQEHFNENYMESDKYPRATIKGTLGATLQLADGASETFNLSGALDIHGVTRDVEIPVLISRQGDNYTLSCDFIVESEAHEIEVPRMLFKKIAREVQVTVTLVLEPAR